MSTILLLQPAARPFVQTDGANDTSSEDDDDDDRDDDDDDDDDNKDDENEEEQGEEEVSLIVMSHKNPKLLTPNYGNVKSVHLQQLYIDLGLVCT